MYLYRLPYKLPIHDTALVAHFTHGIAQMIFNTFIVYNIHTFACGVQVKCIFSIQQ